MTITQLVPATATPNLADIQSRVWPADSKSAHATPEELRTTLEIVSAWGYMRRGSQSPSHFWAICAGLVTRNVDDQTRRYARYTLTDDGKAFLVWLRVECHRRAIRRAKTEVLRIMQDAQESHDWRAEMEQSRYGGAL